MAYPSSIDCSKSSHLGTVDIGVDAIKDCVNRLFSGDEEVRENARRMLENNVVVQGYTNESGFVAVVFACAEIRRSSGLVSYQVLDLLFEAVAGHSDIEIELHGKSVNVSEACVIEVVSIKEELINIADHHVNVQVANATFDILAELATIGEEFASFLAERYHAGSLRSFRDRLLEDGVITA